ncbi:MAG TPA: bi-domain-containing oxidoreductase [Bryobacterales bacterium]|nr:bi-domain-containing oxidoreductase [Bryobacterales bacterium]
MLQLVQNRKSGAVELIEVPAPACGPRSVLVQTLASAVSAGTERHMMKLGRQSMLRTAWERPDRVSRAVTKYQREGLAATVRAVREKTGQTLALGYSSCGRVVETGAEVDDIRPGDLVACAGQDYASHAEIVAVPRTLVARVPGGVAPEHAAFAALGAIAIQGVRLARVEIGETAAVIGLGLLGQLTVQLLLAAGCRVAAIDLDRARVDLARQAGATIALTNAELPALNPASIAGTPHGADAVLITADSSSSAPVELAAQLAREKGRVVAVGLVKTDLPRHEFFLKELEFVVSRSTGPGRYDPSFEADGRDYPYPYVRWTQTRNLEAFLDLLARGRITLAHLISHRYPFAEAPAAYDLLLSDAPRMGIVFEYPQSAPAAARQAPVAPHPPARSEALSIGVLGAGSFARGILLPALAEHPELRRAALACASGIHAREAAQKFGFATAATSPSELLAQPDLDAVFVATPHSTHAALVSAALEAGKHVFVEKPLCVTAEQLGSITEIYARAGRLLMAGFNRRFSPFALQARELLAARSAPLTFDYRVNAGPLPPGHWLSRPEEGGRIIGEVCHFVDLVSFLSGSLPARVLATGEPDGDVHLHLTLDDGSSGVIRYLTSNRARLSKERLEISAGDLVIEVDDFLSATVHQHGRRRTWKWPRQDKGHRAEIAAFLKAVREGGPAPIDFESLARVTRATFAAGRSLRTGEPVSCV